MQSVSGFEAVVAGDTLSVSRYKKEGIHRPADGLPGGAAMIFRYEPALSAAFSALYALMETALLALFLKPYVRRGCARAAG